MDNKKMTLVTHHLACNCREEMMRELARMAVKYAPDTCPDDMDAEMVGDRIRELATELGYIKQNTGG